MTVSSGEGAASPPGAIREHPENDDRTPGVLAGEGIAPAGPDASSDARSASAAPDEPAALDGLRVLVVEDEALIGMMLQDMVEDLGMSVVGNAANRADALRLVNDVAFDLAILDFNLAGESSVPVAEALVAGGRPFVFSTGYEARYVTGFPGVPVVSKPYEMRRLADALRDSWAARPRQADGR